MVGGGDSDGDAVMGHLGDLWCGAALWIQNHVGDHVYAWVGVVEGSLTGRMGEMVAGPVAAGLRGSPRSGKGVFMRGNGNEREEEVTSRLLRSWSRVHLLCDREGEGENVGRGMD